MKEVFTSETYGDLSRKIEEFMENYDVYDYDNVTIVTEKVNGEKPDSYHWKATLIPKDTRNALEDLLIEEHGIVPHFFSDEDIQDRVEALFDDELIPTNKLTKEQMDAVRSVLADTDCEYGLNWDTIDDAITDLFDGQDEDGGEGIDLNSSAWDIVENNFTPDQC